MVQVHQSINQASQILSDNVEVLRSESGLMAHVGKDDYSVALDQSATMLEGALMLIREAKDRIGGE